ncbi:putative medium-chain acyl-CoA dehydrogenase [Microsporum ferrugineum]
MAALFEQDMAMAEPETPVLGLTAHRSTRSVLPFQKYGATLSLMSRPSYRQQEYPHELHAALSKDGWIGIALPEELGGAGLGISEATMMLHTIAQSGAGLAGAQSIHANVYATQPVARFASEEQRKRMLPRLIAGEWRVCFGVTEPNTGLDTLKLRTVAVKDGDSYRVSGQKMQVLGETSTRGSYG